MVARIEGTEEPCDHRDGFGSAIMPDGLCILCNTTPNRDLGTGPITINSITVHLKVTGVAEALADIERLKESLSRVGVTVVP